jgi:hypothetical protein
LRKKPNIVCSKTNSTTEVVPSDEDPEKASQNKDRKLRLIEKLKDKRRGVNEMENTDFQVYACTGVLVVLCVGVVVIKVFLEDFHYEELLYPWFRKQMEDFTISWAYINYYDNKPSVWQE